MVFFSFIGGTAGNEGQNSWFFLIFLDITVDTRGLRNQGWSDFWRWWISSTRGWKLRDCTCAPDALKDTLLESGAFKAPFSSFYPNICIPSDQQKTCLCACLVCFHVWSKNIFLSWAVLKRKHMGIGIAPNTVHFKINAGQQQQGKTVSLKEGGKISCSERNCLGLPC